MTVHSSSGVWPPARRADVRSGSESKLRPAAAIVKRLSSFLFISTVALAVVTWSKIQLTGSSKEHSGTMALSFPSSSLPSSANQTSSHQMAPPHAAAKGRLHEDIAAPQNFPSLSTSNAVETSHIVTGTVTGFVSGKTQIDAPPLKHNIVETSEPHLSIEENFKCIRSHRRSDYCIMKGDVRLDQRANLFILYARNPRTPRGLEKVKPYTRKWDSAVMDGIWTFTVRSMDAPEDANITGQTNAQVVLGSPRSQARASLIIGAAAPQNGTEKQVPGDATVTEDSLLWNGRQDSVLGPKEIEEDQLLDSEGHRVNLEGHWSLFPEPPAGQPGPGDRHLATLQCNVWHSVPVVVFTTGGYTGNLYHEIADGLVPLYISTRLFHGKVIIAIAEWHWKWIRRYGDILRQMSNYPPLLLGRSREIHCFPEALVGQVAHDEFRINPSLMPHGETMKDFQKVFLQAYSGASTAHILLENDRLGRRPSDCDPLLTIIVRGRTRVLLNKQQVVHWAQQEGFAVQVVKPSAAMPLRDMWAALQETDVMLGVHGAAMTHFVFMRSHSIFIQLIPLGTSWSADVYYGQPSKVFGLQYIDVPLQISESSLSTKYAPDDPILKNPQSVYNTQGYAAVKKIYMEGQNVTWSRGSAVKVLREARQRWVRSRFQLQPSARQMQCQG